MGILDASLWKAEWIGAPWQGEETYKTVEPERPIPVPPGMSTEVFMKMVQQYMDNPQSNVFGRQEGESRSGRGSRRDEAAWSASTKEYKTAQTPAPLLRKRFTVAGDIASAKAFVVGLGYYEFYLNGEKIGNEVLVPNQTNYSERPIVGQYGPTTDSLFRNYRVLYTAFDITDLLLNGENVAGPSLRGIHNAVGQYQIPFGSSRFLCQIEIDFADGSHQTICTDRSWKSKQSPSW